MLFISFISALSLLGIVGNSALKVWRYYKTKKELKEKIIQIDGFAELTAGRFVDNLEKFKKLHENI